MTMMNCGKFQLFFDDLRNEKSYTYVRDRVRVLVVADTEN